MFYNKAIILGNLTRDPEIRTMPSGQPVATFGVATNRVWTDRQSGQKKEEVQFHNVVVFGRLAELANQYLSKGSLVLIEGRIRTRNWETPQGIKRYVTEIIGEAMQLGPRSGSGRGPLDTQAGAEEEVPVVSLQEEEKEAEKTSPAKKKKKQEKKEKESKKKEEIDIEEDIPF